MRNTTRQRGFNQGELARVGRQTYRCTITVSNRAADQGCGELCRLGWDPIQATSDGEWRRRLFEDSMFRRLWTTKTDH